MANYNKAIFGTNYRAGQMPSDIAPTATAKIGQNRVFNFPLKNVRYTRLSEGMVDAYWRGMSNKAIRPSGQQYIKFDSPMTVGKDTVTGGYFAKLPKQTRVTKPPLTPLSKTWPKSSDVGGLAGRSGTSPELLILPKEKPASIPSAKEIVASRKEFGLENSLSSTYTESTPRYIPSLSQPIRQGETMDAYGIQIPGARRRKTTFFEDDAALSGVGPLSLGGSGVVGDLRENFETATQKERSRFSGISLIPEISGVLRSKSHQQEFLINPLQVPRSVTTIGSALKVTHASAQQPNILSIVGSQLDLGQVNSQIPAIAQTNIQIPRLDLGLNNVQVPTTTLLNVNVPKIALQPVQMPRLDILQIQPPQAPAVGINLPPFDIPPMSLIIPPPILSYPFGGLGGGGGGGSGYGRSGFEFPESLPLGDFLTNPFGGAGLDFAGLGDAYIGGFGSGKVRLKKKQLRKSKKR
jgi:hypothetical protein